VATTGVYTLLALNQEFVVPRIAHAAYETRGGGDATRHDVESFTDHSTRISIDGKSIRLSNRTIDQASFVLPAPSLVTEITILETRRPSRVVATLIRVRVHRKPSLPPSRNDTHPGPPTRSALV
jgi:hypothetical protein